MFNASSERGFSILELMIGLAVTAILATTAVPGYQALVANNRTSAQTMEFFSNFVSGRSEAIKRGRTIVVCKSSNGQDCSGDPAVGWEIGQLVFINEDNDVPPVVDAGEQILRVSGKLTNDRSLVGVQTDTINPIDYLSFNGNGDSSINADFTICDERGAEHARAIIVSNTGRTRVANTQPDGGDLQCP